MTALFAAGYISNSARTNAQMKQAMEDLRSVLAEQPGGGSEQALTIVSGSVTPAANAARALIIDTEAAAATDDLTNLVVTNVPDGGLVLIRNANAARAVVVKHLAGGSGQINLRAGADAVLLDTKTSLLLKRNGTQYDEVRYFPDRQPVVSKNANYALVQGDHQSIVRATASITMTLPTAAAVGNGWQVIVETAASFLTTFSGTINGISNPKLAGGGALLLTCDGSGFRGVFLAHSLERVDIGDGATLDVRELVTGSRFTRAITSTTTVTAITLDNGGEAYVLFNTVRAMTSGASLPLRGGVSRLATRVGDVGRYVGEPASVTREVGYFDNEASTAEYTIASGNLNTGGDTTINVPTGPWKKLSLEVLGLTAGTDYQPYLRINSDTGANYDGLQGVHASGAVTNQVSPGATAIPLLPHNVLIEATNNPMEFYITIGDPAGITNRKKIHVEDAFYVDNAGTQKASYGTVGRWNSAAAVTSLQLLLRASTGSSPTGATVNASGGAYSLRAHL